MSLAGENLVLQAKTAILEEQVRKFRAFQAEGQWREALQQFHATLQCAGDVLRDSLNILEQVARKGEKPPASES
jgi:hypothetical protein